MKKIRQVLTCLIIHSLVVSFLTKADPDIAASPAQIDIGLSGSLDVNCTFSLTSNPSFAALFSLIISRASNMEESFTEIASIIDLSGDKVNLLTTETVKATGFFDPLGDSYLNIRWDYPTELQAGVYKCSAQGYDPIGRAVIVIDDTEVTARDPSLDDWKEKLHQLDIYTKHLEQITQQMTNQMQSFENKMSLMTNLTNSLEKRVISLETEKENRILQMFETRSLTYNNKKYYVSSEGFSSIEDSIKTCKLFGGHLVEINDLSEYQAVRSFLQASSGFEYVVISGSEEGHKGTWTLPSTNQPLPFTDWYPGEPNSSINCLCMWATGTWRMGDWYCRPGLQQSRGDRFMCEVPQPADQ